jgi:hypothetical protein
MNREARLPQSHMLVRLFGCELRYPEYCLAGLTSWWGLWTTLFVDFTPAYAKMNEVAPEWVWGVIAMSLGVALWLSMAFDRRGARRYILLVSFIFWLSFPNWQRTGLPTYSSIAVFYSLAYLRLSGVINLK